MRRFAVLLGATAPAVAAALTAFFFGLGLGSFLLGRLAPRLSRPLRTFALLEIGTGISALAVDPLIALLRPLYASMYDTSIDSAALQLALKMLVAASAILVPTACMGGTLPVLSQFVASRGESLGVRAGGLYAVNTIGAAAGAVIVPALLLPSLGGSGSLLAVAALSVAIGLVAIAMAPRLGGRAIPAEMVKARTVREQRPQARDGALALAFVSGVITLALETFAARAFALIHENSVYSFATVLAVFLTGLGAGAATARVLLRRGVSSRALVSVGWAVAGAWMLLLPALFVWLTDLSYLEGGALLSHELRLATLAAATLLGPSALLGLALPALMHTEGSFAQQGGPAVGRIVAANTLGSMAGPLLALFVLAPLAGLWGAFVLLGATTVAFAVIASRGGASRLARQSVGIAAAVAVAGFFFFSPASLPRMKLAGADRLLDLQEGAFGSVAVIEHEGHRRIKLNNFYVLGGSGSAADERLQGHIPMLLHPKPDRVAYLGLGTGISLSAVRFHPAHEALALELVPEVALAARQWFGESNLDVLKDPRVRVRAEDARSYIGATSQRFDVIVGDLVVPWRRGESSLFTRESFASARGALAPGGIFCQWIPLYQISEPEFDSIAASFLDVFPQTTLWKGDFNAGEPAVALIGHTAPQGLSVAAVDERAAALARAPDTSNPYLSHPAGLWLYFVGPLNPADPRFRDAPRNRDLAPWVELTSPRLHLQISAGNGRGFVARPLKARLDGIRSAPLAGTVTGSLDAAHLEWRELGADIWEASLLSFEGNDAAADRLGIASVSRLPAEIQRAVFGGAGK